MAAIWPIAAYREHQIKMVSVTAQVRSILARFSFGSGTCAPPADQESVALCLISSWSTKGLRRIRE